MKTVFRCIDPKARIYATDVTAVVGKRYVDLCFRIDGRGERYRVDVEKPLFPAWEAIDGGEGFGTLTEAKTHIRRWLRAAVAQQNLTPTMGDAK